MYSAGDDVVVRETGERGVVLAALDGAGTLLVAIEDGTFAFNPAELERPWARHARCC